MNLNQIVNKKTLGYGITMFDIYAPDIVRKSLPGNFVILRLSEKGERIPITINDWNREKGTIRLIIQEVGKTTKELGRMKKGDCILNLMGPLGHPSQIDYFGRVVCIGGGVGTAVIYPIARALKDKGNEVISIVGARTKELIILEKEMQRISLKLHITTDDGSYGRKGLVTAPLREILDSDNVSRVIAAGPLIMMKNISEITKNYSISTIVSLNPIMVDGTGMCGGCRVKIGNEMKFACVDGPEFDAHLVDFEELMHRNKRFLNAERNALEAYKNIQTYHLRDDNCLGFKEI